MSKLVFEPKMMCVNCQSPQHPTCSIICQKCGSTFEPSLIPKKAVACAMVDICPDVTNRCRTAPGDTSQWRTQPNTRYIDCYSYKTNILGLKFTKTLGVYHLSNCPFCNGDLEKHLQNKLNSKQGE